MAERRARTSHAERVLRYMKGQDRPLSAYEILDGLRAEGVTASTTVYRALDKLLATGQVHRIESLNAWAVCSGTHEGVAPVFAICDDCGSVTEHVDGHFTSSVESLAKRTGFSAKHAVLEIHGRCGDCDHKTRSGERGSAS